MTHENDHNGEGEYRRRHRDGLRGRRVARGDSRPPHGCGPAEVDHGPHLARLAARFAAAADDLTRGGLLAQMQLWAPCWADWLALVGVEAAEAERLMGLYRGEGKPGRKAREEAEPAAAKAEEEAEEAEEEEATTAQTLLARSVAIIMSADDSHLRW